ncbi:MAG: alginate lyase family protein [Alphaproteobacteria bacterium]
MRARLAGYMGGGRCFARRSRSGVHVRKWSLGILASSYLQIRDEASLDAEQRHQAERWLKNLARDVMNDYERETGENSRHNNHIYWAAT